MGAWQCRRPRAGERDPLGHGPSHAQRLGRRRWRRDFDAGRLVDVHECNDLGFGRRQTIFTSFELPPEPAFPLDIRQNVQVVMLGINLRFSAR